MDKIKALFQTSKSRNGSYSVGLIAIAIAITVVINLLAGQLPESLKNIDVSDSGIYEISDTSREMLSGLKSEVTLTMIGEKASVDDRITTFVNKYAGLSKKVTVKWVDPVQHPSALEEYDTESNSIVVSCADTDKSTSISFSDIIQSDEYSYYTTGQTTETAFDGDGQLTSAISNVTSDVQKNIYYTSGHGEGTFSTSLTDLFTKSNLSTSELNLLMNNEIPEDCDLLILNAPTSDIQEEEAATIKSYLEQGGKVMVLLGDTANNSPNLESVLEEYGLAQQDGYIADTQRCYQGNYYYIFPQITASGDMSQGMSNNMVLLANALGLSQVDPARDTISVETFMTTSADAYAVTEDDQKQDTYVLGAVATESISGDTETEDEESESEDSAVSSRLTVISSSSMIDANITDSLTSIENLTLFMNAVTCNFDDVSNVSIPSKSLEVTYNTVQHGGLFSMMIVFGIPVVILITGFVIWMRRRKQ